MANTKLRVIIDGFTWREGNKWKYRTYADHSKFEKELDMFLYINGYKVSDWKIVERKGKQVNMRYLKKENPNSKPGLYYVPRS